MPMHTIYHLSISVLFHKSECEVNKKGNNDHDFMTRTMMKEFLEKSKAWPKNWPPQKSPSFAQTPLLKKTKFYGSCGVGMQLSLFGPSVSFRNPFLQRICAPTKKTMEIHGKSMGNGNNQWKFTRSIQEGKGWVYKHIGKNVEKWCNESGKSGSRLAPHYPGTVEWHPKSWLTGFKWQMKDLYFEYPTKHVKIVVVTGDKPIYRCVWWDFMQFLLEKVRFPAMDHEMIGETFKLRWMATLRLSHDPEESEDTDLRFPHSTRLKCFSF